MRCVRTGWLAVDDQYDGRDEFCGTDVELYADGPYLGRWDNLVSILREFDGKRVRITVEVLDA